MNRTTWRWTRTIRAAVEEFEEASARLSYALYFIRREIECALHSRDTLTDAHSSGEMVRDLREWQALVTAVKLIAAHLRLSDKVFRCDASKFLIRLSGTDLASGKTVIMRLRDSVTHGLLSLGPDGSAADVTASFGIAMLDPEVDALESIDRADQALTLAKTAGRNRMITWDPSVTTGVRLRWLETKDVQGQAVVACVLATGWTR